MQYIRNICAFKLRVAGDELSFEIGWLWIALIVLLIYVA